MLLLCLGGCQGPHVTVSPGSGWGADVFVGGVDTPHVRIPALIQAGDGALLAFAEGRPEGGDPGETGDNVILYRRSMDGGATWGPVQCLAKREGFDFSDPRALREAQSGAIFLFFTQWPTRCAQNRDCVGPGLGEHSSVMFYRKSLDEGRTWLPAVNVNSSVKDPQWRAMNTGPGFGIQLARQRPETGAQGRLLFPALFRDAHSDFHVVSVYSDDAGQSWKSSPRVTPLRGDTEAVCVELGDGTLLLSARNDQEGPPRHHYRSQDGGLSWTPLPDLGGLTMTRVTVSLVYLPASISRSPRVFLVAPYGPEGEGPRNRTRLGLWESFDEGVRFQRGGLLAEGFAGYSQAVLFGEGLGLLYEAEPTRRIRYLHVPLKHSVPQGRR